MLGTVADDGSLSLWDVEKRTVRDAALFCPVLGKGHCEKPHRRFPSSLTPSRNDSNLQLASTFTEHKAQATSLCFSPANSLLLCTVGLDRRAIFYDVNQGR